MFIRLISILVMVVVVGGTLFAQGNENEMRVRTVGILSGRIVRASSPSNIGDDGLSRLQDMLVEFGASVQPIAPEQPISDDVELLILIRPQRRLSIIQTDILWNYLRRGGHLLLAFDPYGHAGEGSELAQYSGINRFLGLEYGLGLRDTTLVEPWFGMSNLSDLERSGSYAFAEELDPHAITEPLVRYQLPIRLWGAREITLSSPNGKTDVNALLYVETAYGESRRLDYRDIQDSSQLQFNLEEDAQGRLIVAGIAEHYQTGSRVALVGDSELFQNLYGQTLNPANLECPLYVGDYLFTQRLLVWLMGIPEDEWPSLPASCMPMVVDGDSADWDELEPPIPATEISDTIQGFQVFYNDHYLYLALTLSAAVDESLIDLTISGESRSIPFTFGIHDGVVSDGESVPIVDAAFAESDTGNMVEIRVPLRVVGNVPVVRAICDNFSAESSVCVTRRIRPQSVETIDPVPMRITASPTATLRNSANLRAEPSTDSAVLTVLPPRVVFAIRGRDESGDWLYVMDGRYEGWLSAMTVSISADMDEIPVITP